MNRIGPEIHGEFEGDASTATAIPLYLMGAADALTLKSKEIVVITDIVAFCGTADKSIEIWDGATEVAGKRIFKVKTTTDAKTDNSISFGVPRQLIEGNLPYVKADDGTEWTVIIHGYLLNSSRG